jgi:hypothetical protein
MKLKESMSEGSISLSLREPVQDSSKERSIYISQRITLIAVSN